MSPDDARGRFGTPNAFLESLGAAPGAPRAPLEVPGVTFEVPGDSFWGDLSALRSLLGPCFDHFDPPGRLKNKKV